MQYVVPILTKENPYFIFLKFCIPSLTLFISIAFFARTVTLLSKSIDQTSNLRKKNPCVVPFTVCEKVVLSNREKEGFPKAPAAAPKEGIPEPPIHQASKDDRKPGQGLVRARSVPGGRKWLQGCCRSGQTRDETRRRRSDSYCCQLAKLRTAPVRNPGGVRSCRLLLSPFLDSGL